MGDGRGNHCLETSIVYDIIIIVFHREQKKINKILLSLKLEYEDKIDFHTNILDFFILLWNNTY